MHTEIKDNCIEIHIGSKDVDLSKINKIWDWLEFIPKDIYNLIEERRKQSIWFSYSFRMGRTVSFETRELIDDGYIIQFTTK